MSRLEFLLRGLPVSGRKQPRTPRTLSDSYRPSHTRADEDREVDRAFTFQECGGGRRIIRKKIGSY